MKYLSLSLLLLVFNTSYSQTSGKLPALPLIANRIVYSAHITTDTALSKEQLFRNAEEWYRHNFETADNTLIIDNVADGRISGTGIIHAQNKERTIDPRDLFFTIDLTIARGNYEYNVHGIYSIDKDNKFYYSDMYNEELYPLQKPKWPEAYRHTMLYNMNTSITAMIEKMCKYIQQGNNLSK